MKKYTKIKRPHVAELHEVIITRQGDAAIIEYKEKGIGATHITIGHEIDQMSDNDILLCHNSFIALQLQSMKDYQHVATEIPIGESQVEYFEPGGYWTARGDVLRCCIGSDNHQATVIIDDKEFSMDEFGKLLSAYEGWGMRIVIVPEDEIHKTPLIEKKNPPSKKETPIFIPECIVSKLHH
ncbi:hypothetical protein SC040_15390 [Legionella pneumophila]|uniref:DUF7713 domain-containing protein n=1 Tax=Legionella pneumophila TaxID=446 RepID=UPI00077855DB|nr:hypothetical protein [Legionella pneumophila]HAT8606365.1 hypothetical protein [Legionella pneumophila]